MANCDAAISWACLVLLGLNTSSGLLASRVLVSLAWMECLPDCMCIWSRDATPPPLPHARTHCSAVPSHANSAKLVRVLPALLLLCSLIYGAAHTSPASASLSALLVCFAGGLACVLADVGSCTAMWLMFV
jgi:hypothetical protein